jgi:streptogramin lyase
MRVFNRLRAGRSQISQDGRPATVMRRLGRPAAVLAGVPILILGLAAGTAAAASGGGQISNYSCAGINEPFGITAGPNGQQALWFTNAGGEPSSPGGSIGEITTSGQCSNFGGSLINDPTGITAGPDGALWFTNFGSSTGDSIGEITTSGKVTSYTGTGIDGPEGITVGPDVNGQETLWFTNTGDGYGSIGEITFTASGQVQEVYNYPGTSANGIDDPTSITAGPDGSGGQALWFANGDNSIGEITTAGTVYNYSLNQATSGVSSPYGITAGPNGTVWFTFVAGGENSTGGIGEITPTGLGQAQISYPSSDPSILNPHGITAGPDGALWFANNGNGNGTTIGRITTSPTTVNSYSGPGVDGPESITPAPDGAQALWFTNYSGNSIGEITTPTPQTITFTSTPPSAAVYSGSYTPVAAGGSGQPVKFTVDPASTAGACKINSSGAASFTGVGTCIIDANQAGNADWLPAPQVQQSFTIGQAAQTITFTSTPPASPAFGSSYTVSATGGGSGNPVTFVIDAEGLGPCVISGSTVTFIGAGSCVIGAGQAGNADYQAATAQQVITVPQEAPVLTWDGPANIDYPVPLSGTQLDATASVAGTFTYSPPAGTVLGIGAHTLTATFTPTNTTNYTSGTVSTQITVVKFQPPPCPTCHK